MGSIEVQGSCHDDFAAVRAAFEANFAAQGDVGASVAVTVDGQFVVDLWGGSATYDAADGPWGRDTIINVWSTTKTMAALCCLVLADRGELDLYEPIATYWPEFAANGKERIATRHVLAHTAGLSGWEEPVTLDDLLDHDKVATLLAAQAPWWEPGSAPGYHAVTQGYLEGEIVRRVTGRSLGTFFAEEIAGPLGADFHIGTGPDHDARIAHVIPPPPLVAEMAPDPASIGYRTFANPVMDAAASTTTGWRRAEIPAAGGHGNARAVARVHSATACGGSVDGVQIMSPEGVDRIFDVQIEGQDLVLPLPVKHGMGYGLPTEIFPVPEGRICFWGGWGGSLAFIDVDRRMSFAYVMNKMGEGTVGDLRGMSLLLATYQSLAPGP